MVLEIQKVRNACGKGPYHHENPAEVRVLSLGIVLIFAKNKAAPLREIEPSQEDNPNVACSIVEPDEGVLNPPLPPGRDNGKRLGAKKNKKTCA
jgi:hypothetical protein